jgi:hypothetical protein
MASCDVCGSPLRIDNCFGVCRAPGKCRNEYQKRRRARASTKVPCRLCATPIQANNSLGVCSSSPECRAERRRLAKSPAELPIVVDQPKRRCLGCEGPIGSKNVTGFCTTNPDCNAKVVEMEALKKAETARKCDNCSGPIARLNTTGFCSANKDCDIIRKRFIQRMSTLVRIGVVTREDLAVMPKQQAYELAEKYAEARKGAKRVLWTLENDGEIDDVAVYLACNGIRHVALTDQERIVCILRMISNGARPEDMRRWLHVGPVRLKHLLDGLGWELIQDPHVSAHKVMLLTRKDRPKNKILPPEVLDMNPAPKKGKRKR